MRSRIAAVVLACIALVASPRPAPGAITVTYSPASGPSYTLTPVGSKTRVTLNSSVAAQPTYFYVRGGAADQIEQVILNCPVSFQTTFVEIRGSASPTATIASVDSIDQGSSAATCVLLGCRTSGNVGTIRLNTIAGMNIGGDVTGSILHPPRSNGGEASLISGTVTGRIRGNIIVDHGAIYALSAVGGLGAPPPGVPIQVRTKLDIARLTAREIYADISTLSSGGAGVTATLRTTGGPFVGSLATQRIAGALNDGVTEPGVLSIAGDLDADITIVETIANENGGNPVVDVSGRFMPGRVFRIGTTLAAGAQVRFASPASLQGQVIINAAHSAGAWDGSVTVGGGALGPVPMYTPTSGSLGGGSVGHVPFHMHASDCWPATGAVVSTGSAPRPATPIRVRCYGPVTWTPGQAPLVIEAAPLSNPTAWRDQTPCFTFAREPGATPSANVVAAYPSRALPGGWTFRVRPVVTGAAALVCDLALSPNPPVYDDGPILAFTISGACAGDADSNGLVNFADLSAVLANWSIAGSTCVSAVDTNADGTVSFGDVTTILASFGAVCP